MQTLEIHNKHHHLLFQEETMSSTMQDSAHKAALPAIPEMKLELVPLPVADVDRSKDFYEHKLGFNVDHDVKISDDMRIVQMTPPGSACSVVIGRGMGDLDKVPPGMVKGLHLVVADIQQARTALAARGVEVGEVIDMGGILYVWFSDPDGNSWALQEITVQARRPDHI